MTQDEIIEMAEKTGVAFASDEYPDIWQTYMHVGKAELEAFAKLVAAKEREWWKEHIKIDIEAAKKEEREACAKICETLWNDPNNGMATEEQYYGEKCSEVIRARGD